MLCGGMGKRLLSSVTLRALMLAGAGCSTTSAPTAGDAAAPKYQYISNCPYSPVPHCSPTMPAVTDTSGTLCSDLGIGPGDACSPGDPVCVLTRGLRDGPSPDGGSVDGGARPPCVLRAETLTCTEVNATGTVIGGAMGCPSSTAKVKKHIEYLTPSEVSEAAREIRELPLVRYRYRSQGDDATPTVGIVIEDVPGASFVYRENQRVNLYSFVSATAAAYQAQAKELEVLKARLAAVEARCGGAGPPREAPREPSKVCRP